MPCGSTSNEMSTRMIVSSSTISQMPRLTRKLVISPGVTPRARRRYAPVPARKKNTGAQKCVIHRVKKSATDVFVRSVGSNWNCAALTKSRVWSSIMMTITSPRSRSIESMRCRAGGL